MEDNYVDIIIPVYNETILTKNCIDSIAAKSDTPYRFILIDNASADETRIFLQNFARSNNNVALISNKTNLGWVKAVNQGIGLSSSPYVCIMNNDTVVKTSGWLAKMIAVVETAGDIGLVNPCFDSNPGTAKGEPGEPYIEIDFCRGYCVLIKRTVIIKVGGLDEAYGLGYYDDDDLSVRAMRAGFICVRANDVVVEHLKDTTFSAIFEDNERKTLHEKNKQLFYEKWGRRLKIVFIVTKGSNRESLKRALLLLARRQHIVYLWNLTKPLGIKHTNIRERSVPGIFSSAIFALTLYFNAGKKAVKRYDLVFVDDPRLGSKLSKKHPAVHCVDVDRDADKISQIVDSTAKTKAC
ncbi:MAG: glycosyltransferase family 2 protein [Candidatus Omnitrophica bacterium]|nr:glycosyltransferase family 2 protein [Candidatus Omnitrophota bacterium]